MILLTRVDDRLLHGQVLGAWVPFIKADLLLVASDDAAADSFKSAVMRACGDCDLEVDVRGIDDATKAILNGEYDLPRVVLVLGDLKDAMRLYEKGFQFPSINIGNIHHSSDGRKLCMSVSVDALDDDILEKLSANGVKIDIRDLPTRPPTKYEKRSAAAADSNEASDVDVNAGEGDADHPSATIELTTEADGSVSSVFTIKNRLGLHARAASLFVQCASKFGSDIFIAKDGNEINAKSIMGILILAAGCGSKVKIRATGEDEAEAVTGLGDLINRGFDEEDV